MYLLLCLKTALASLTEHASISKRGEFHDSAPGSNYVAMEADVGLMKIGQLFKKENHCSNTSILLNAIILMLSIIYYQLHIDLLYLISTCVDDIICMPIKCRQQ